MRPSVLVFACTTAALLLGACASTGDTRAAVPSSPAPIVIDVADVKHPQGETPAWWYRSGAAQAAQNGAMGGHARNVILFLGDGMSLTTVAAARIFEGQLEGGSGEEHRLAWERFPYTALSKTYETDSQVADSGGTMTSIMTGVKTYMGAIGVTNQGLRGDCEAAKKDALLTWLELADSVGMGTGVVTTTRLTHATPAATYAHSADRNWENDSDLPPEAAAQGCTDIAQQMLAPRFGKGPTVALGGGREEYTSYEQRDPEYDDKVGLRLDGRDLTSEWKAAHPGGAYVWNEKQFAAAKDAPSLLGLFEYDHMQYDHDRPQDIAGEPSLAEMTTQAIHTLSKNPNGYVLMVEGGRIDHASHAGNAYRALTDTVAFAKAVQAAADATNPDDTLIVVTADHSHTLTFVGYSVRGNPILGKVHGSSGEASTNELARDAQGMPYTTLNYMDGPGYVGASNVQAEGTHTYPHVVDSFQQAKNGRPDLTRVDTEAPDYMQEAMIPMKDETHGGDDVGIWARGPGAQAFHGSLEQNAIYHVIVQATPKLREKLCAERTCDKNGVPVELPKPEAFMRK